eukprot:COSAG02_NODE_4468_length_5331_cov_2.690176_3_plen_153_part_00
MRAGACSVHREPNQRLRQQRLNRNQNPSQSRSRSQSQSQSWIWDQNMGKNNTRSSRTCSATEPRCVLWLQSVVRRPESVRLTTSQLIGLHPDERLCTISFHAGSRHLALLAAPQGQRGGRILDDMDPPRRERYQVVQRWPAEGDLHGRSGLT